MLSALHGPASATIARNMQDYWDMAVKLLRQPQALQRLHLSLEENWRSSPLFDVGRWVGDVEVRVPCLQLIMRRLTCGALPTGCMANDDRPAAGSLGVCTVIHILTTSVEKFAAS